MDLASKIKRAVEIVEEMLPDGLVVITGVDIIRLAHSPIMEVAYGGHAAR